MAVRIRMKKLGRRHRPFFRVCAMDSRAPRDGRVIEELGYYDPMVKETDARAILNGERIDYWLSVGAQPSENVKTLIKKYGTNGTHLDAQEKALERLKLNKPTAPPPMVVPRAEPEASPAPEETESAAPAETDAASAETTAESPTDASAEETPAPAEAGGDAEEPAKESE